MKERKMKLDSEEQTILEAFESGKLSSVPDVEKEIKRTQKIFKAFGNKTRRVNLRMTEWDFSLAKEKALQEGLPYQTFLASVLHKYLTGQFGKL